MNRILTILLTLFLSQTAWSQQEQPLTRILFIFDASNSMNGVWEKQPKIKVATELLTSALDSLRNVEDLELALRVYGHEKYYQKGQDCDDTKLLVPFGSDNVVRMKSELMRLKPKGTTPIAATLEKAADDFPKCPRGECRNIIILITDGIEECNGDPCAVSLALQKRGIVLKPFVIGVGLNVEFRDAFECVGTYFDASDKQKFKTALGVVISQALNNTTAQVNLLDFKGNPTETNVNMTFYDQRSGEIIHNFVHTMNVKGNPDTLALNPMYTYRVVAHTIPPKQKDSAVITPGTHTIIGIPAPQGDLEFKMQGINPENQHLQVIVRSAGTMQTLHVQQFIEKQKYIVGKYDLEILTLPRTYIADVAISQSHTTTIEIPQPGIATFSKLGYGYGTVYLERKNKLELVATLSETKERETLSLQPGNYVAVFRPKQARGSIFTVERRFTVTSGASVAVKLN
jgi:Ca-activated chloride channel family protein